MAVHHPSNVYREQLSSLSHGLALWNPKPVENIYNRISIGDVGYLLENGAFMRLFNVMLPWDDPSNRLLEVPEEYKPLELGYFINVHSTSEMRQKEHCSHVSKVDNIHANTHNEGMGQMYECQAQTHGALLSLPHGGHSEDVFRTKVFEGYIRDNADSWLRWSKRGGFPVERIDDLILVTGCTLVTSWAAAVFDNTKMLTTGLDAATISLDIRSSNRGGAQFIWGNNRGNVDYHNSHFDPTVEGPLNLDQCAFIRGFRARRILFRTRAMRAAAEPLPDNPDNRGDDEIQVTRIPDGSKCQYRDPLVVILDYIEEKCQEDSIAKDIEDIIAIAHHDDLQLFEDIETVTADAIEKFLHEKKMPLLIENGAAILRDPADDRSPVSSGSPYPLGFVRQQNPRQITLAEPSSQASAGAWDPLTESYLHQLTSGSRSPNNPRGSPYPLDFVHQQNLRQMTLAEPSSQASAGAWNPWARSYSHQSTSESHPPYNPGGFQVVRQQSPRPIAAVPLSQGPSGVQNAWLPSSQARWPLPEDNWNIMAGKKRKALVIGIDYAQYPDRDFKLRHCAKDAYEMASFLYTDLGFAISDIRVLTDEMENSWDRPTKENILQEMRELVRDPQPGDTFFLYFSGHGVQIKDIDGDESDGLGICAMDYRGNNPYPDSNTPGLIVDDIMDDLMVKPLPPGCRLTVILDCCPSRTILDLPDIHNSNEAAKPFIRQDGPWIWSQNISSADVVTLSISKDNQEAAKSREGGALRRAFIDSVSRFRDTLTYKGLIRNMRDYMRRHGFEQEPQLTTSYKIDTNLRFVV